MRIQGKFLWPASESFQVIVRRPTGDDGESRRGIGEIPPEEIALAMKNLVRDSLSIEQDKLIFHVARIIGFERTGNHIQKMLESIFSDLLKRGEIVLLDDRASLPD